jgi:muramoyltetrapeptide carboxypeptidase
MITAPFLSKNDIVAIVAPGRKIKREEVDAAIKILDGWEVKTVLAQNIFSSKHSYLAGTDEERLEDFQTMIDDDSVKAIICARGGYGSTRIVDRLNFHTLLQKPKWIVGFSDITAIHLKLFSMGIQSIHGTMPVLFAKENSKESVAQLHNVLFGGQCVLNAAHQSINREGKSSGQTVGGNLSLILDSMATNTELDLDGKILIIEEVDEYSYRIDRMMIQLKRAGKLKNLSGLVVGHFTDIKNGEIKYSETFEELILDAVSEYQYPVAFGFPTGHENPNFPWIHGGHATLLVDANSSALTYY